MNRPPPSARCAATAAGGDGADTLEGYGGDDAIYGGKGADVIVGWESHDTLHGGSGNDTLVDPHGPDFGQSPDSDVVYDGPGDDVVKVKDGDGDDTLCTVDGETFDEADPGDALIDDPELCSGFL